MFLVVTIKVRGNHAPIVEPVYAGKMEPTMSNSISVDVVASVLASFSSVVNEDRKVKEEAIASARKQIEILQAQISACESELSLLSVTPVHEARVQEVLASLPVTLSDGIKITTCLQVLAEENNRQLDIVFNSAPKGASATPSEKSSRESKEDFRARLISSLSHTQETTVKEISEKLGKNPAQVNRELNLLVALNQAQGIKRDGSRTIFYKLV
jgi:hypothetical protein